jgi:hypothetical protein
LKKEESIHKTSRASKSVISKRVVGLEKKPVKTDEEREAEEIARLRRLNYFVLTPEENEKIKKIHKVRTNEMKKYIKESEYYNNIP